MLEGIARIMVQLPTYRYQSVRPDDHFERKLGLDSRELDEITSPTRDGRIRYPSRFTDGSFDVRYTALERDTAEAEIRYWTPKRLGADLYATPTAYHYHLLRFDFSGEVMDLRLYYSEWPQLTDDDYSFCNSIGKEAHDSSIDGLLVPSARLINGSNLPVFSIGTLSNQEIRGELVVNWPKQS